MTASDALSRLRTGLDRDEALARAAAERAEEWRSDGKGVAGGPFIPADPEWGMAECGEYAIVYDEGYPLKSEAIHIAEHDPARVLRQVAAIRKVIERYEFVIGHGPAVDHTRALDMTTGATAALRDVIEMLASAYPAPTEAGELG